MLTLNMTDQENNDSVKTDIKYIRRDMDAMRTDFKDFKRSYVNKEEFKPVKSLVYGVVVLILTGVMTALVALVIRV